MSCPPACQTVNRRCQLNVQIAVPCGRTIHEILLRKRIAVLRYRSGTVCLRWNMICCHCRASTSGGSPGFLSSRLGETRQSRLTCSVDGRMTIAVILLVGPAKAGMQGPVLLLAHLPLHKSLPGVETRQSRLILIVKLQLPELGHNYGSRLG